MWAYSRNECGTWVMTISMFHVLNARCVDSIWPLNARYDVYAWLWYYMHVYEYFEDKVSIMIMIVVVSLELHSHTHMHGYDYDVTKVLLMIHL